jgi:hypothetical protein
VGGGVFVASMPRRRGCGVEGRKVWFAARWVARMNAAHVLS